MKPAAPYQQKNQSANYYTILILALFAGIFISPLMVAGDLHDPTRTGKIFFFAQWMLLAIPVGLIVFIRNRKQPVDNISLLVLIWGAWISLRGKYGGIWHDEKFFWFAGCFVFFFLAGSVISQIIKNKQLNLILIPSLIITIVAGIEAVMGLLQLYGGFRIYHGTFKVTGTFFNPAPYAGFLLASFPWALLLTSLKREKALNKIIYWFGFISLLLVIVILPSTRSRAAYLGLAAAALVWLFYRYKLLLYLKYILNTKLKRQLAFTVVPVIIIVLLTGLYLFKKDSADGRLLIWKVTGQTIKEKPLAGHGFNTAQATLAPAQAAYFAAGLGSENEQILAGSVRWAFNEPLQAASETGLPGALLLLLITGYALFFRVPKALSRQQYLHIGAARSSLAGIAVFGCFSYPFYSLPVTLLFFYALTVLAAFNRNNILQYTLLNTGLKLTILTGAVLLSSYYLVKAPQWKQAYWLWDEASSLYRIRAYPEANESFAEAYPILKYNGLFLQQYGKSLAMEERNREAVACLTEAENYYKDEFGYITLGDCYKALGEYYKAEDQYQLAANMVPHKFYPLYLLANLYSETGQKEKAVVLARQLLNKEVKVPSQAIEEIQEDMREIIDSNSFNSDETNDKIKKGKNYTKSCTIAVEHQFW